ncbi:hypothetical protein K3495_g6513 [Podosphaera aphanis]|nr:hypothetical protein K3495_g6513 [Podosphaera aphanis]
MVWTHIEYCRIAPILSGASEDILHCSIDRSLQKRDEVVNRLNYNSSREENLSAIGVVGRAAGARAFKNWQATRPRLDLFVYSDGALIDNRAGAGYSIYRGLTQKVGQGSLPLGSSAEVYDAEVTGATAGLSAALTNPMAYYATNVTVCLDNQEAALRLIIDTPTATSFPRIALFRELVSP